AESGPPADGSFPTTARTGPGVSPEDRARAYVQKIPDLIAGEHGHDRLYHVACVLVDGFGLSYQQALPIFEEWNRTKARPPESDQQIQHKLDDAIKNHPVPSGTLWNAPGPAAPSRNGPATAARSAVADDAPIVLPEWLDPPDPAAHHGLAGEIVRTIE